MFLKKVIAKGLKERRDRTNHGPLEVWMMISSMWWTLSTLCPCRNVISLKRRAPDFYLFSYILFSLLFWVKSIRYGNLLVNQHRKWVFSTDCRGHFIDNNKAIYSNGKRRISEFRGFPSKVVILREP